MFSRVVLGALLVANGLVAAVYGGTVQKSSLKLPRDAAKHRDAVKSIFLDTYHAYKYALHHLPIPLLSNDHRTYAFGHDDLTPVSKSFSDGRNGWGATIVDALTTLVGLGPC